MRFMAAIGPSLTALRWFAPIHYRSRMWLLVGLCQLVVTTALVTTELIGDRMENGLTLKAAEFIASDLRISDKSLAIDDLRREALEQGLRVSHIQTTLTSAVSATEDLHLVQLKAVDAAYPLRGTLSIEDVDRQSLKPPVPRGTVWIDSILRDKGLAIGQRLRIGDLWLHITGVIVREPDRVVLGPGLAARVMINHADLIDSGLIGPNSRSKQHLLLAGPTERLSRFLDRVEIPEKTDVVYAREGRRDVRQVVDNLSLFVNLAGFVAMLFAAVILYLSLQLLATEERRLQRLLWQWGHGSASRNTWFWSRVAALALIAGGLGMMMAYGLQELFARFYLSRFFVEVPDLITTNAWWPAQLSVLPVAALSIWSAVARPSAKSNRHQLTMHAVSWLLMAALVVVFFLTRLNNPWLISGLVICVVLSIMVYFLFVRLLLPLTPNGMFWSLLKNNLSTRPRLSVLYVCSLSLIVMIAMTVYLLREGMLLNVKENFSAETPNHYLLSIQPDEVDDLSDQLSRQLGLTEPPSFYPIVRARVIRHQGEEIDLSSKNTPQRMFREWGLSYLDQPSSQVVEGQWFQSSATPSAAEHPPQWSVSLEVIESLDAQLGDSLTFRASGGEQYTGHISSIRKVNWGTIKPNFFVLASPGLLNQAPKTYITAMRLDRRQSQALVAVVSGQFPGVTHFDLDSLISRFKELLAVFLELMWVVLLYTSALVLVAVACILQFGIETSRRESALLTSFGVSGRLLRLARLAENVTLAGLAVLPAMLVAGAANYCFQSRLLQFGLLSDAISVLPWLAALTVALIALMTSALQRLLNNRSSLMSLKGQADYHS